MYTEEHNKGACMYKASKMLSPAEGFHFVQSTYIIAYTYNMYVVCRYVHVYILVLEATLNHIIVLYNF